MRYYLVVVDSFGIGADDIAGKYGDEGSNTALSASRARPGKKWSFLCRLGLGNISEESGTKLSGCAAVRSPMADYGFLRKASPGKDTQTGHWELAGLRVKSPMITFPQEYPSFPADLIEKIEKTCGHPVIGNYAVSGTEVIKLLGEEQSRKNALIVYTSADSVLQIAANEADIPHEELHEICRKVRTICDEYGIGRVIARPYVRNSDGTYTRTKYRKDFSVELPGKTVMDGKLKELGVKCVGVGKIGDIFNMQGIDLTFPDKGNEECLARCISIASGKTQIPDRSFVFINLVDTDMEYGHRRNAKGYCDCVQRLSGKLEEMYKMMDRGDVLAITADHGCDPNFKGTDHTREYVPFLRIEKGKKCGRSLGNGKPIQGFDYVAYDAVKYFTERQ